jgi:N-acyl-D-aspartate/D-glutamate deacylase
LRDCRNVEINRIMTNNLTLAIRNGTIVDGTGREPFEGDIGIAGDRIVQVGRSVGRATEEIDARGMLVTPGFVDIHTHYDGQVTWSNQVTSSSLLGVTSVLMGNCGVGFAPCHEEHRQILMRLMEGVEDIPGVVLAEGLPWNWTTFADYLDALEARRYDADIATQIGHAPLRVYVMGERGAAREPASDEDKAAMGRIAGEAVRAGALGFSTSRTIIHRSSDGSPTPSFGAAEDELTAIARGLTAAGRGVLQLVSDFDDVDREFAMLRRVVEQSRRPMSLSLLQHEQFPDRWRRLLGHIHTAVDDGLEIKAQVGARPVAIILSFALSMCPFSQLPTYESLKNLPAPLRLAQLRDPQMRARILSEEHHDEHYGRRVANFDNLYALRDPPDYEPHPDASIAAIARREGRTPAEVAYDLLLENDGQAMLYRPLYNYADKDLEVVREMLRHRDTLPGLSDGGAHYGYICDASFPTYLLTHWVRDRSRGERIDLPTVIKWQTQDTAAAVGLHDRGVLLPGYKADVNVIDFDRLRLRAPQITYDLPAGGRRLSQKADGYRATIVSGVITYRDGVASGALPGRLVRGARARPVVAAA